MTTKEQALKIIRLIYPKSKIIRKESRGYSHEIFEFETGKAFEKMILKICVGEREDKFSLKKEGRIHQILQEIGIPVPKVIEVDDSRKIIPLEFMMCSYLKGENLDKIWEKLPKREQEEISEKMGEILGKIHNIKFDKCGVLKADGIDNPSFSFKKLGKGVKLNSSSYYILGGTLHDLCGLVVNKNFNRGLLNKIFDYLVKNQRLAESKEKFSLIHGDFIPGNIKVIKVRGKWEICGVLDFEYAASMPKEYDFIKLHRSGFFEKEHLKKGLLKGYLRYQKIPKNFEEIVKFMRICRDIPFAVLLFKAGNFEHANKVIGYIKKEISSIS
jgi:aminoglycoside phosphotransferase (APT) family kinase protein